jgi:hypothetical protein
MAFPCVAQVADAVIEARFPVISIERAATVKELTAADVIRIHEVALSQLIPAIPKGLPYSQLIKQACWLSYEIGLVVDERVAQYPEAVQDLIDQIRESGSLERLPIAKLGHDILATCGDGRRPDWLEAQTTCAAGRTRLGCSLGLHSVVHWTLENVVIATSGSCLDGLSTLR